MCILIIYINQAKPNDSDFKYQLRYILWKCTICINTNLADLLVLMFDSGSDSSEVLDCKTAPSFAMSPKSGVFERVLTRGREMGERGEDGVVRPGEKGNGEGGGKKGLSPLHSRSLYRTSNDKQTTGENQTLARIRVCTLSVCIM